MTMQLTSALVRLRSSIRKYEEAAMNGTPSNTLAVELFRATCGISDLPVRSVEGSIGHLCDQVDRFRSIPVSERTLKNITAQAQAICEQVDHVVDELLRERDRVALQDR